MTTTILDGKETARLLRKKMALEVNELIAKGVTPGLGFVLVGDNPASQAYVRMKKKACAEVGIESHNFVLPVETSQEELLKLIDEMNNDSKIDGFIVQLPLPDQIDEDAVIAAIDPKKDVDCFHPMNVGKLCIGDTDGFFPCTPYGIVVLLKENGIETSGKHVVIIGRSNIVGKPLANLLVQKRDGGNSTVTVCHSRTKNIPEISSQADIVVAAIGKPNFVTSDMVGEGAVVVDVGINRVDAPEAKRGYKLVGDVDFENVSKKASAITPVPGGVGPMTIAMLLENCVKAAKRR